MPVVEKRSRKDEKMVGMERRRNTVSLQLVRNRIGGVPSCQGATIWIADLDCLLV
jgi:hypothetical protein